jgi:hypothetical protein
MTESSAGDTLVCADCGRSIGWHSDEAREWAPVEDGKRFGSVCPDCYRMRYGDDESRQFAERTRDEQEDERTGAAPPEGPPQDVG